VIKLSHPTIDNLDLQAVQSVLQGGSLVQGKHVSKLEQQIADRCGLPYAVAVNSCTSALYLGLLCLGISPDDLVIVPSYSWIATANAVAVCKAHPVFVDIDSRTFNIDLNELEKNVKRLMRSRATARRLRAIIIVHAFGQMTDIFTVRNIASQYGIAIIEDAACALGASYGGRAAGSTGAMGCFSMQPRKAITTGEGGIVITSKARIAKTLRALRNHGQEFTSTGTKFVVPGFNFRMTEMQGALGVTQLAKLDQILSIRRKMAAYYNTLFADTPIGAPFVDKRGEHAYQSYIVKLPRRLRLRVRHVINTLKEKGIETNIGTCHMPLAHHFKKRYGYKKGDFPETDDAYNKALSLPLHAGLSAHQQKVVANELIRIVGGSR